MKEEGSTVWDCGSSLYDYYELASMGHLLEIHTMAFPFLSTMISPCKLNQVRTMKMEGFDSFIIKFGGKKMSQEKNLQTKARNLRSGFYRFCISTCLCKTKASMKVNNVKAAKTLRWLPKT